MNKGTKIALISFGVAVIIVAIVLIVIYTQPKQQEQLPPSLHDVLNIAQEIIEEAPQQQNQQLPSTVQNVLNLAQELIRQQ